MCVCVRESVSNGQNFSQLRFEKNGKEECKIEEVLGAMFRDGRRDPYSLRSGSSAARSVGRPGVLAARWVRGAADLPGRC